MDKKDLVYQLVSFIPQGKVLTYGQIAKFLGVKSARTIGQILHQNPQPNNIPCHRVVFSDGSLSKKYAFGGKKEQEKKLKEEGVNFYHLRDCLLDRKVVLEKSQWWPTKVLRRYFYLLKKFGSPGLWPWFSNDNPHTKEEIVIGSILTQNTQWVNVEKALKNLRKRKINSLSAIYQLGKKDLSSLKQLIRPSGFYHQKGERLFALTKFIIEDYRGLKKLSQLPLKSIRERLLSVKGIGEETADTILLYALEKPIFVIDAYTRRFVDEYFKKEISLNNNQIKKISYQPYQKFFMDNLPTNLQLFQDYHALIVRWGKEN